jgi:Uma2 family endonuclease
MSTTSRTIIGPADHGRRMTLDEFVDADFEGGWLYELARGVIDVTEVPGIHHGRIVLRLSDLFALYNAAHPGVINYRAAGSDCRIRFPGGLQSDRHPDQAIYLGPPPEGKKVWERWVPDIVVEVVSEGGEQRDFVEKAEEYCLFGVQEYWILDPNDRTLHVHSRKGNAWGITVLASGATCQTPLLPGLELLPDDLFGPVN